MSLMIFCSSNVSSEQPGACGAEALSICMQLLVGMNYNVMWGDWRFSNPGEKQTKCSLQQVFHRERRERKFTA